jgi:hypothetical protein
MPSRLALRPCGSGFPLAACATRSQLALRPRGSALPSRVTLHARGSGCGGGGGGGGSSGSDGSECSPSWLALRARRLGLRPRSSRYALAGSGFALAAWATRSQARALPSRLALRARRLGLRPRGLRYALAGSGFALTARLRPLCPRGSRYTLAARLCPNTTIKQQSSGRKSCFGSTAAYLPKR